MTTGAPAPRDGGQTQGIPGATPSALEPLTVRTVMCRQHLPMGKLALSSLVKACGQPLRLVVHIHEDPKVFTPADAEQLANAIPGCQVLRRQEYLERILAALGHREQCRRFVQESVFSIKLLDLALLSDTCVNYLDCDILFFRRFFKLYPDATSHVFNEQELRYFSGRLPALLLRHRLALLDNFNAGFLRFFLDEFDLDFIEWFLGRPEFCVHAFIRDQTCFAAMLSQRRARMYDYRQVRCSLNPVRITPDTVAVHFLGHHHPALFAHYETALRLLAEEPPRALHCVPARRFRLRRIAWRAFRRRVGADPYR